MKKSTKIKVLVLCVLLVTPVVFIMVVSGNRNPAGIDSDHSKPDWLMADIGIGDHPFSTDAPAVKLRTAAGDFVRLDDYRGKVVFLNFWATWCPTCVAEMPAMEKLHRKVSGKNFAMLAVNIKESASRVKSFFDKNKLTFTALLDTTGEVGIEFGLRAIPTTFILDKSGNIIGRITGPRDWDSKDMVALFEQLADTEIRGQKTDR